MIKKRNKYPSPTKGLLFVALLALTACSHQQNQNDIAKWQPFPSQPELSAINDDTGAPNAPAVEAFDSVSQARHSAISHSNIENNLSTNTPTPNEATVGSIQNQTCSATKPKKPTISTNSHYRDLFGESNQFVLKAALEKELIDSDLPIDLWQRIRDGFSLADGEHAHATRHTEWFAQHQKYLDRTFTRAYPYLHYIVEEVEKRGMPMEIVLLPVVESAFQPFAYSHGRASGIWQFIPGTGRAYGLTIDWWYDGRRDITASTQAALNYLERLQKRFDGDWLLALAAYNSGEGTVYRAIRRNQKLGKGIRFWDLKLPRETRDYVPKLLAISNIVANPKKHNVTLLDIPNAPHFTKVNIDTQIDLALAADMAEISLEKLYIYNPGFNRWATPPEGPHTLLFPIEKAAKFQKKLSKLPKKERVKWVRHKITQGENLGHIAKKYKTTVSTLQRINDIQSHMIRAGKHLLIPVASRAASSYTFSAEQRLENKKNTPRGNTRKDYVVRSGDTLWDISRAHKVSIRKLASWNNMAPRDTLALGQKLVIWTNTAATQARINIPTSTGIAAAKQKIRYRVRQGDSLARISQRFNVSVNKLRQWNPRMKGKYIQPGQMLVVYVDVTKMSENT